MNKYTIVYKDNTVPKTWPVEVEGTSYSLSNGFFFFKRFEGNSPLSISAAAVHSISEEKLPDPPKVLRTIDGIKVLDADKAEQMKALQLSNTKMTVEYFKTLDRYLAGKFEEHLSKGGDAEDVWRFVRWLTLGFPSRPVSTSNSTQ